MLKIITVLMFGFILLSGCESQHDGAAVGNFGKIYGYDIVVIEKCEYIYSPNAYGKTMTHKGNCKNPIHIYK